MSTSPKDQVGGISPEQQKKLAALYEQKLKERFAAEMANQAKPKFEPPSYAQKPQDPSELSEASQPKSYSIREDSRQNLEEVNGQLRARRVTGPSRIGDIPLPPPRSVTGATKTSIDEGQRKSASASLQRIEAEDKERQLKADTTPERLQQSINANRRGNDKLGKRLKETNERIDALDEKLTKILALLQEQGK